MTNKPSTTEQRSALMKAVRQHGTSAELAVRHLLTRIGARYRLNAKGLPGRPDIVNRSKKKAVFVHGCFWHMHTACGRGVIPKSNSSFWEDKLQKNQERDERKIAELLDLNFDVLIVWECELRDPDSLKRKLVEFWNKS